MQVRLTLDGLSDDEATEIANALARDYVELRPVPRPWSAALVEIISGKRAQAERELLLGLRLLIDAAE